MPEIEIRPLPAIASRLCTDLKASKRLAAHLALVHDAAVQVCDTIDAAWPGLPYDREAVLVGAATHDLGKVLHPRELTGPGSCHERDGPRLLLENGCKPEHARFAGTHGHASDAHDATLEDLLVALADGAWKGARLERLETRISEGLAALAGVDTWETFAVLDATLERIGRDADARLAWQAIGEPR